MANQFLKKNADRPGEKTGLLKQFQHILWQLVRLRDHRSASLLKNLCTAQIGCFSRKVSVHDTATGCGLIFNRRL
jgi:hypothetical protein